MCNCIEFVEIECVLYKVGFVKVVLNLCFMVVEVVDVVGNCMFVVFIGGCGYMDYMFDLLGFGLVEWFVLFDGVVFGYFDYEMLFVKGSDMVFDYVLVVDDFVVLYFLFGLIGCIKVVM